MSAMPATIDREALRQRQLLRALFGEPAARPAQGWLQPVSGAGADASGLDRGLGVYRANAGALAERALGAAFPTVAALIGEDSFAALARHFWHEHPPARGDIAMWGGDLPRFVAAAPGLRTERYLADVARLEWAVHVAATAADAPPADAAHGGPPGLMQLAAADLDPARLRLELVAGTALVESSHPIVAIWRAHREPEGSLEGLDDDRFAPVRAAFAAGRGETARVWREGLAVRVAAIEAPAAGFERALLGDASLAQALDAATPDFDFGAWLADALRTRRLARVHLLDR